MMSDREKRMYHRWKTYKETDLSTEELKMFKEWQKEMKGNTPPPPTTKKSATVEPKQSFKDKVSRWLNPTTSDLQKKYVKTRLKRKIAEEQGKMRKAKEMDRPAFTFKSPDQEVRYSREDRRERKRVKRGKPKPVQSMFGWNK